MDLCFYTCIYICVCLSVQGVLRVDAPKEALLFVLVGPVGAYYPTGLKPVSLLADPKYVRAWPGGSGNFKMGW